MTRPTRQQRSGRAYLDLQNLAKRQGRATAELLTIYALAAIREIASIDIADGLRYDTDAATAQTIRDDDEYTGIRVTITTRLARAVLPIHIDINVGDPVAPPAEPIALPRLLGGTITLTGYPIAMVHAEKIVTAIQRGTINTRWRDFADIYLLSTRQPVNGTDLQQALTTVATARKATLVSLNDRLSGYPALAQSRWAAWLRKHQLTAAAPLDFSHTLEHIRAFADPALQGEVAGRHWHPTERTWTD